MSDESIRISEIFGPTIQGEGALIGQPTVFVRTGGCDYRCSWCDTLYAVESKYRADWKPMSAQAIMAEIETLSGGAPIMVTLSGGNPAIQPLGDLITLGHTKKYQFALETQGSISAEWFAQLDVLTLSPKPPSSGMNTDWNAFDECLNAAGENTEIALKIVIADEADYQYAFKAAARYPDLPTYLQPCNPDTQTDSVDKAVLNNKLQWLIARAANDKWHTATILPQLHVLIWGNERGV